MVTRVKAMKAPLPVEVNDDRLVKHIRQALYEIEQLRASHSSIQVEVNNSIARLRGVVATYDLKTRALQAARNIPGVKEVQDELFTKLDLEVRIAQALANDPRTHQVAYGIWIYVTNDNAVLTGHVSDPAIAQLAETIARSVDGVRTVTNHIQVVSD